MSSGVHIVVSSSLAGSAIGVDGSTTTPPRWSAVLSRYTSPLCSPLVGHTLHLIGSVERRGEGVDYVTEGRVVRPISGQTCGDHRDAVQHGRVVPAAAQPADPRGGERPVMRR